jgi:Ca2+-binding EF-hand superfamily protein
MDGYIDADDLEHFFRVWKIDISETDVYALIERFAREHDGRITFHEFVGELTVQ